VQTLGRWNDRIHDGQEHVGGLLGGVVVVSGLGSSWALSLGSVHHSISRRMAIGRIGCFSPASTITYGTATSLPWASIGDGVPRHHADLRNAVSPAARVVAEPRA
jgi:hypothetical protein